MAVVDANTLVDCSNDLPYEAYPDHPIEYCIPYPYSTFLTFFTQFYCFSHGNPSF